jgi:hypothetical protein
MPRQSQAVSCLSVKKEDLTLSIVKNKQQLHSVKLFLYCTVRGIVKIVC